MRNLVRAVVALGVVLVGAGMLQIGQAASPTSGKIDGAHRTISWSGGPLFGSAPAYRRATCKNPATCDEFALDVDLSGAGFGAGLRPTMKLNLTSQGTGQLQILVYQPGSDPSDPQNTDYQLYPTQATFVNPKKGTWHVFASCFECAGTTYTMTASALGTAPKFTTPAPGFAVHEFAQQSGGGEPGIRIGGPDHGIWIDANTGGAGQFWGSYDGGKTWTFTQPDTFFGGGDTWLTVGAGGELYADELQLAPSTDFVFVSKDRGKTWTNVTLNLPDPVGQQVTVPYAAGVDADREWFTADPKIAGTVYFERHDLADPLIQTYKSTDYGQTWIPLGVVNIDDVRTGGSDTLGGCTTGPIEFAPDGAMVFPLGCSTAVEGTLANTAVTDLDFTVTKIYSAVSTDQGQSWALHLIVDRDTVARVDHGRYPIVWDKSGNMYVAYSERLLSGWTTDMYVTASRDKGATWTKPLKISTLGSNIFPAIAAGGLPGNVDVAWVESDAKDFNDPSADWRVVMAQSLNLFDVKATFTKMQISKGIIHHGDVCQAGLFCTVTSGNRNLLDYIWMTVDAQGMAHVAYTEDLAGPTHVVYTRQIAGSTTLQKHTSVRGKTVTRPKPRVSPVRHLPATGVGTGAFGLFLLALAAALTGRMRTARKA